MIYPSPDKIEKEIDSKYALVVLAAKRARQIKEGGRTLIDTQSSNPLTIALEEISMGKVKYEFDPASLAGQEALEDLKAVVGNRDMAGDAGGRAGESIPDSVRAAYAQLGADMTGTGLLDDESEDDEAEDDEEEADDEPLAALDEDSEGTVA